ncbi:MAG: hypothetical protein LBT62_07805 [Deltaproteobacteria bacterium]|nr:hypothetical protein [Deltaproteobacteria bacterium]
MRLADIAAGLSQTFTRIGAQTQKPRIGMEKEYAYAVFATLKKEDIYESAEETFCRLA